MDFDRDQLVEAFGYLDNLRSSGVTNMYGGAAYVERDLGHDRKSAAELLKAWMRSFDGTATPDQRADSVLSAIQDAQS